MFYGRNKTEDPSFGKNPSFRQGACYGPPNQSSARQITFQYWNKQYASAVVASEGEKFDLINISYDVTNDSHQTIEIGLDDIEKVQQLTTAIVQRLTIDEQAYPPESWKCRLATKAADQLNQLFLRHNVY